MNKHISFNAAFWCYVAIVLITEVAVRFNIGVWGTYTYMESLLLQGALAIILLLIGIGFELQSIREGLEE